MHPVHAPSHPTSLAAVVPGEEFEISEVLFPSLLDHCQALGLEIGHTVRCRYAGRASLLLVAGDGRVVSLDRDWARFIMVIPKPVRGRPAAGRGPAVRPRAPLGRRVGAARVS